MKLKHITTDREDYYVDELNRKQGEYKRYHDNCKLHVECFYKDGKREGKQRNYWDNGKLKYIKYYENNKEVTSKFEIRVLKKLWKKL